VQPTPSRPLPASPPQKQTKNKKPYKPEQVQGAVDFQPLPDQLGTSISNFIFISKLNHTRKTEQLAFFTSACNHPRYMRQPREFPSAEALQQRQKLGEAAFLIVMDTRAIERKELATHSHTFHFGKSMGRWRSSGWCI
jgi:hypothetical protein